MEEIIIKLFKTLVKVFSVIFFLSSPKFYMFIEITFHAG